MASDTDEPGQLLQFPPSDRPFQLPDASRLFPTPENDDANGEGNDGPGFTLPEIARPMNPEDAITVSNSNGVDGNDSSDDDYRDDESLGDGADGAYFASRSLSDRIGDWIEFRLHRARTRHDAEAPYREAAVAHKVKLLEAKSGREIGAVQNNGKLEQAKLKASADLAAARGKAQAGAVKNGSGNGLFGAGTSKGRNGGGSGGGSSPASRNQKPPAKPQQAPGKQQAPNKPQPPKQQAPARQQPSRVRDNKPKTDDKNSQRQKDAAKANEERRRNQNRARKDQDTTGGKSPRKPADPKTDGRGKNDGSRNNGDKKGSGTGTRGRRDGGKSTRADNDKTPKVDLRKKPQPPKPPGKDNSGSNTQPTTKPGANSGGSSSAPHKVNLKKDQPSDRPWNDPRRSRKETPKNGPEKPSAAPKQQPTAGEPRGTRKGSRGPSTASGKGPGARPGDNSRRTTDDTRRKTWRDRTKRQASSGAGHRRDRNEQPSTGPVPADSVGITVERADRATRNPPRPDGTRSLAPNRAALAAAPETHTPRPGTSRPTSKEKPMAADTTTTQTSTTTTTSSHTQGLAAEHQTNITFDQYLQEIASIAVAAHADKERAEDLAAGLKKIADALREMSTDLIGDHNIDPRVTDLISNLADSAGRMKLQAEQAATECGTASQAAILAGQFVARTYNDDMQALNDGGLTYASAAAHH